MIAYRIRNTLLVAKYTFKEVAQSKVLLSSLILGLALLLITWVASRFTYGAVERIAIDFGLATSSIAAIGIAIFMGVSLIADDIQQRTVYIMLSRPLSRVSFLIGKVLGMGAILAINILILSSFSIVVFVLSGGKMNALIFSTFIFTYLESLILLLVVVNFSLLSNKVLSVILTIGLFILGHVVPSTLSLSMVKDNQLMQGVLKAYQFIFPNLEVLNTKDYILYKQSLPTETLIHIFSYGAFYILTLLILAAFIFNYKDLD